MPLTVSVKAGPPAVAELGLSDVITCPAAMVKVAPAEVTPFSVTVMVAEPVVATRLAATVAVNCVALTNVVASAVEFHCTTAPEAKPVPLTVSVKAGPPAVATFGLRDVITCIAAMVKVAPADVTPFSTTVTFAVPTAAMRLAGTWAVNCEALAKLVVSAVPFHCTMALETKPVPLTVSVKAAAPAVAVFGLRDVMTGPAAMVNVAPADVTPFSTTVTVTVPGEAMRFAGTWAVNWLEFTKVVVSAVLFHWTIAPERKPVPFTVRTKAGPPAVAAGGLRELITGPVTMVNVAAADVTPFSATVTEALPGVLMRLAATVAVNWVALTKVVLSAVPFHCTTAVETKPVPFTVKAKAAPPALAVLGLSEVIAGPALMVKVAPADVTPFSITVMATEPAVATRLAATGAVNCVALTKVVASAVEFHCTTAPETNPVPLTVSVKPPWPAVVLLGLSEVIAGPALMVKAAPAEDTPFSVTVMVTEPAVATRPAATGAVNCVALTKVVVSAVEFHCTTAPETNPVPLTVSVKLAWPTVALLGISEVIAGPVLMVKVALAEVTPFSVTVMVAEPAAATRLAATGAVNCVALTNVVVSAVEFHCTTAPETNPVPLTVSVKPGWPAVAVLGLSEVIVSAAMVKVAPLEVTPSSVTVTVAEPGLATALAATGAVNCAALTNVVVSAVEFHCTTAPETNPEPLTVSVKPAWPAVAGLGLRKVIAGTGAMVNVALFNVAPLSDTDTKAVPGDAIRMGATVAVNCVLVTKFVGSGEPFHSTVPIESKPVPTTVRVKTGPPADVALGLIEVIVGGAMIVKVATFEVCPLSATVTVAAPAEAMRSAVTVAVN